MEFNEEWITGPQVLTEIRDDGVSGYAGRIVKLPNTVKSIYSFVDMDAGYPLTISETLPVRSVVVSGREGDRKQVG